MTDQDANNNTLPLRENLVQTAVQFLQNPKVTQSPMDRKQQFLKKKGLTDEEIKAAFNLASINTVVDPETLYNQKVLPYTAVQMPRMAAYSCYQTNNSQLTLYQKIKELFNLAALIGATVYCIYWFYKKFIRPFLFGRKKPKINVEDAVVELNETVDKSVTSTKASISKVNEYIYEMKEQNRNILSTVREVKVDLVNLKAMLLSSRRFPTAPTSIPAWQLDTTNETQEKATEREDDAGSGSNNSDSSLEMIREEPTKE
ncbi:peroxisomal membrane protein PEX14 [Harpegnathos saltator]|uniref:Peroxisomal membrane protein PEX14 n=1 Tax=Harpegnathos saltator TaxID=610380 RepID=E2BIZ3_HARSA|nr:peroxisomal membrane protein PEX14 [Harpegnathos saltator]EFN84338.1 Peroxisomal membrane protein PEX14 [Harpegnathos saltator]